MSDVEVGLEDRKVSDDVWAFVFEEAEGGSLIAGPWNRTWDMVWQMNERETWYLLAKFFEEIGSAIRGLKKPHG
jgi:hypothetical protein